MNSKKTKGKQKITIKRIEKDEARSVTLSKRRNGIYTKLSELSILCGADFGFLMYSGSGKPYTFGSPTFTAVAERFHNGEASSSSIQRLVVDAYRKARVEELCQVYNNLVEKKSEEEKRENTLATSTKTLPVRENAWWNIDPTKVNDAEETRKLLENYEELYKKLYEEVVARNCQNSAENKN